LEAKHGLGNYLPIWDKLTIEQRDTLERTTALRTASKGTILHNGSADCIGVFVVKSGQLRRISFPTRAKK
jgi:CRP/FNR family transcriptional regulator